MLDFLFLILPLALVVGFCVMNFKNAKLRGHSGGGAVAYTIGLWFGFGLLGFFIAMATQMGSLMQWVDSVVGDYNPYDYGYDYIPSTADVELVLRVGIVLLAGAFIGQLVGVLVAMLISRRGEVQAVTPVGTGYGAPGYPGQPAGYGAPGQGMPPQGQAPYGQPPMPGQGYPAPGAQPGYGQPTAPGAPVQPGYGTPVQPPAQTETYTAQPPVETQVPPAQTQPTTPVEPAASTTPEAPQDPTLPRE